MYHLQIAVSLVHCFSFTSLPSVSGYSVNIQQDRNIHTLQYHITIYKWMSCIQHTTVYMKVFSPSTLGSYSRPCARGNMLNVIKNSSQWKSLDLLITWWRSLLLLLDQILLPGTFLFQFLHLTTLKCQSKSSTLSWSMIQFGSKDLAKQSTKECQGLLI